MPRPRVLALLLPLFLAAAPASHAEDDGLNGSYEVPAEPGQPPAGYVPEPRPEAPAPSASPEPAGAENDYVPPPVVPLPKPSLRFNLDERVRFRRWLTSLCRQEPVSEIFAARVHYARDAAPSVTRAANKQGSLLLLLENYAELAQFRDDCEAQRKKDPSACLHDGRIPHPWDVKDHSGRNAWLAFGSQGFWAGIRQNRTPAGITPKTDLLAASKEQVDALQRTLNKDFFELRDAADLNGKPGSAAKARQLVEAVRSESTCGTRAVTEGLNPRRSPAQSQK